eukprot:3548541-Rhodomonas_salina.3
MPKRFRSPIVAITSPYGSSHHFLAPPAPGSRPPPQPSETSPPPAPSSQSRQPRYSPAARRHPGAARSTRSPRHLARAPPRSCLLYTSDAADDM